MVVEWGPGAGPLWSLPALAQLPFVDGVVLGVSTFAIRRRAVLVASSIVVVVAVPGTVLAVIAAAFGRHADEQGRARIQARRC